MVEDKVAYFGEWFEINLPVALFTDTESNYQPKVIA
jgi:hypothetical protein